MATGLKEKGVLSRGFLGYGSSMAVALLLVPAIAIAGNPAAGEQTTTQARTQVAESRSAGERASTVGIDAQLLARLDQAAAAYKKLAAADVASLVTQVERLEVALEANDRQAAQRAWIEARAAYEHCEIFLIKFPYLDAAIESESDSSVGFHAIEAKLFTPGAPLPVSESQELSGKVHTLQTVFSAEPIYAHGVIVGIGSVALKLTEGLQKKTADGQPSGGDSAISGTSLNDIQHKVEGMELAWNSVFSTILREKNKGVADRVEREIAEVKQLVSVASLQALDVESLETKAEMLAGSVSDGAVELGWNQPNFEDTD